MKWRASSGLDHVREFVEAVTGLDPEPFIGQDKDGAFLDLSDPVFRLAAARQERADE